MKSDLVRIGKYRLVYGYAMCLVCLLLARDKLYLPGIGIALLGIALRVWSAGHIQKNREVTTGGPYSFTRNPLYLGSFVFGVGAAVSIRVWWLLAVYAVGFAVFYWPTILSEERYLSGKFGEEYQAYRRRVPAFFPWKYARGEGRFSLADVVRNKEHLYALTSLVFLALLEVAAQLRS